MSEQNLIPAGDYRAVAVPAQTSDGAVYLQFTKASTGNDQIVASFELLDGPCAGRKVMWFAAVTANTYERVLKSIRYMGWKGNDLFDAATQELTQEVSLSIGVDSYDGKTKNKVNWVNAGGGSGVVLKDQMSVDQRRQFAAKMKAHAAKIPEVAGRKGERGAAPSTGAPESDQPPAGAGWGDNKPAGVDDDIPF